jgi:hypothetical protein
MVRDEADIIEFTLRHTISQHVDMIAVLNNLSVDNTVDIIRAVARHTGCPIEILDDNDVAYYQSRKMTNLAAYVHHTYDIEWIIPFDADELWHTVSGVPLADYLRSLAPKYDRVDADLYNYFPCDDDTDDPNPFVRIVHRDRAPAPLPKVCLRWNEANVIHQGNHGADGWTKRARHDVVVRHFPWRSYEQFERKVRNGAAAYAAAELPDNFGAHWRNYGRILDEGGPDALRGVYEQWFTDPDEISLVNDPAPYGGTR